MRRHLVDDNQMTITDNGNGTGFYTDGYTSAKLTDEQLKRVMELYNSGEYDKLGDYINEISD